MRNASLALLACLLAAAPARATETEAEWIGFDLALSQQASTPGQAPAAVTAKVFFSAKKPDPKGSLDWIDAGGQPLTFDYFLAYPLFTLEQAPNPGAASSTFTKTPSQFKLYQNVSQAAANGPVTVRLVVTDPSSKAPPRLDRSFTLPKADDLGAAAGKAGVLKTLNAKTLKEWFSIPDGQAIAVQDKPAATPGPAPPQTAPADPLKAAIETLCRRAVLDDDGKVKSSTPQCEPTQPVFFYAALKGADALPSDDPNKSGLIALRDKILALGAKPWTSADDPAPINQLRSSLYVQQMMARYVQNGDPAIKQALSDAGLTDDQVMGELCGKLGPTGGLRGSRAWDQLASAGDNATVSSGLSVPEEVASGQGWDKQTLSNKCQQYRQAHGTVDPRTIDVSGQQTHDGTVPPGGATSPAAPAGDLTADGRFHPTPDPPTPDKPPTNPYKNYIQGAKFAIWGAVLGFIFGGPAGALLMGAAAAGAGYYMSKYK